MDIRLALTVFVLLAAAPRAQAPSIKLATLLTKGSSQCNLLEEMKDAFGKAKDGGAKLTVYADFSDGEQAMVSKMRLGSLHAGLISAVGLAEIEPAVSGLQFMPMMFRSLDEVDHAKEKLAATFEKRLLDKGFVVLFWTDAGWIRFFATKPFATPDDLKKLKLFAWSGDGAQFDLMKRHGFNPIPLQPSDIKSGLLTGMIDAAALVPFMALGYQLHTEAKHMVEVDWAPLVGALVVTKKKWDSLAAGAREDIERIAKEVGAKMTARNRLDATESVDAMVKRGLVVKKLDASQVTAWRTTAEQLWPEIRGKMVPAEVFDDVQRILVEYRKDKK